MSIPYDSTIPQPGDNPSISQGEFLTNFGGINSWTNVDHFQFSSGTAGQHKQVTLPGVGTAGSPSGFGSTLYTAAGTASNTTAQLFWKNANATFHSSSIRAWGFANSSGIISNQGYNATVTRNSVGNYTVTMPAGAVSSANYSVIVSCEMNNAFNVGGIAGYSITNAMTFQLYFRALSGSFGEDPNSFSFEVKQI
jgi:hypothetical protein